MSSLAHHHLCFVDDSEPRRSPSPSRTPSPSPLPCGRRQSSSRAFPMSLAHLARPCPHRTPSAVTLHAVTFALCTMASLVARPPQLIHPCPHPDTRTAVTVTVARPLYLARRHNHAPFPSRLLSSPHMPSLLRTLHTWTHLRSQADSKVTHLL
jgi:hypothetical protein